MTIGETYQALCEAKEAYRDKLATRDGCPPVLQIALATLHNQQVAHGSCLAIACMLAASTLRALVSRGLIDDQCRPTRKADDLLKQWTREDRQRKGETR